MAHLICEQTFDSPLNAEGHDRAAQVLGPCLEAHGAVWQRSYLSADGRKMFCHFEAPDAEAVRASYRNANLPFERVWVAELFAR